jgi:general secretion pathway protein L
MSRWMGIDITQTAVRVALLRATYRRTAIEALREERIADHETPSAALRAATVGLKADAYATALAGSRAFVRFLSLPKAAQKAIGEVLGFEVESTLPFEMDDAVMDHRILSPGPTDAPEQLPILAGVAYTEEVRDRIGLVLRGVGHEPQRVGVGPLPLANLGQIFGEVGGPDLSAILELAETHSDFVVLRDGVPRFVRSLSQGTSGLPESRHTIARELKMTLAAWRMEGGEAIDKVYVVGVGRDTPGVESFMQSQLGVQLADLPKAQVEELTPDLELQLPRFAKALGIALSLARRGSDLDLRQGPLAAQQSFQFLREKTPLLAGLTAAIFVSFGFSVWAELRALSAEGAVLERQLEAATMTHFGEKTNDVAQAQQLLEDAISGKTDDPIPKVDAFDLMVELSQRIPQEMVHDIAEFEFNRDKVTIKGVVPTIDDANKVAEAMREHPCFKEVNITRTTRLQNQDKQKYTLELNVRCGAAPAEKKKGAK